MRPKERANKIANKFVTKSVFEMNNTELKTERENAKRHAIVCVNEIIEALEITTGHCELRKLDYQEVQSDFKYWNEVKEEINKL